MFGKHIQKYMERAEQAGRAAAEHEWKEKLYEEMDDQRKEWGKKLDVSNKALADMSAKFRQEVEEVVNERLSNIDHAVNPDSVLTASYNPDGTTKLVFLNKEQLGANEIRNLKSEVSLYKNGKLWDIINSTLKKQAEDVMFVKLAEGDTAFIDAGKASRAMLRTLDIQRNIMDTIEKA